MIEDDDQLLQQFVQTRSAKAFDILVRRHVGVVHAAAIRQVRDRALAEDVTQAVFIVLVNKAAKIQSMKTIGGWLLKVTRYAAIDAMRKQETHRRHERSAAAQMPEAISEPDSARGDWDQMVPVLDDAISRLGSVDRDAIVLRYFQNESFTEIGRRLGLGEEAARKRVDRALKKLRSILSRNRVALTAAAIATAISTNASAAAPPPLVGIIVAGIGAGIPTTGLGLSIAKGAINMMAWAKLKFATAVASVVIVVFGGGAICLTYAIAQQQAPVAAQSQAVSPTTAPSNVIALPDQVPAALVEANNRFATDLIRQFDSTPGDNTFFSPYSISTALAMTYAGARGNTAAQMAAVLHLSELPDAEITPGFGALQRAMADAQKRNGSQLSVANSLWPDLHPEHQFLSDYMSLLQNDLDSAVIPADYQHDPEESRNKINHWVEDKTKDKIKDLILPGDLTPMTRLVLVNAIYFKGRWISPFQERLSAIAPFTLADKSTRPVVLMHQTFLNVRYADVSDLAAPFQMISMDYSGDPDAVAPAAPGLRGRSTAQSHELSMVVLVPRNVDDLPALEKNLKSEQLGSWIGQLANKRVEVFLPKFQIDQRYLLNETLKRMGMVDAFDARSADFSGMNGARDLSISKVIHQTFINVNEIGTEAAAATAVAMLGGGVSRPPDAVVRADRPFLFLIRENTSGSILFMGRLTSPAAADSSAISSDPRGGRPAFQARNNTLTRGPTPTFTLKDPKAAATTSLQVIQDARKDTFLVNAAHPGLDAGLRSLESAARTVLSVNDIDATPSDVRINQFSSLLIQASTLAHGISVRPTETQDVQASARQLEAKLLEIEKK